MKSLGTAYLFTNRCILRRFELSDAYNVFYSYAGNLKVAKYLNNEAQKNVFDTEYMISEFINNYNNLNYYNWIVLDRYNKNVIGTISLHEIDIFNDKGEIGIIISPYYQNQGYGKEIMICIINFAFNKLLIHRLEAKVMVNNFSSNKLVQSLGFNFEGVLHSIIKKNNRYYDVNLYYLINK